MEDNHLSAVAATAISWILRVIIASFLALFTLGQVFGLAITAPGLVTEGSPIDVAVSGQGFLQILAQGTIVATGMGSISYTMPTNTTSAGLIIFTFTSSSPAEQNGTAVVEVEDVPLTIDILAPTTNELTTTQVPVSLSTNLPAELCYATVDGSSTTLLATTPTLFEKTVAMAEGVHTVQYKCKLGNELPTQTQTVIVDASAPLVTSSGPSGEQVGPYIQLAVDTNEIAKCRYGEADLPYAELPSPMATTYALRNTATVHLTEHGSYTYFVRCQDVHGNAMSSARVISFLNKVGPSADISIVDAREPLTSGTYEVSVKTSLPLENAPSLTYTLQDSGAQQSIPLTGGDDAWKGFFTIPEGSTDTVLSFAYRGTSLQGVESTVISDGGLYVVDAEPPEAVSNLRTTNESGTLELRWFAEEDEDLTFRIYRSDVEGVTLADYYSTTSARFFKDAGGTAQYYYYKVAAVDDAGNIGPLSIEIWGSPVVSGQESDPLLRARVESELQKLTGAIVDANATIATLEQDANPTRVKIIERMGLLDDARSVRIELEDMRRRLASSQSDQDTLITQSQHLRDDALRRLITRIEPGSETVTNQPSDPDGLGRNLPYAFSGGAAQRDAFLAQATALQDGMTVRLDAMSFTLWNTRGEGLHYTYVEKRLSLESPVNDVRIVEVIPKTVAEHASDIIFTDDPTVLADDPVIGYSFPVLENHAYSYVLDRIVSLEEVKKTRTFAYPQTLAQAPVIEERITGNAIGALVLPSLDMFLIGLATIVIIGLLIYYVSISREDTPFKSPEVFRQSPPATQTVAGPTMVAKPRDAPSQRQIIVHRTAQRTDAPVDIKRLLANAEREIDEKNYDASLEAYKHVISLLHEDPALHAALDEQIHKVYEKLMLHKTLYDAKISLQNNDGESARQCLEHAREYAERIGEGDSLLLTDAKRAFTEFVQQLNKVEIENMGRYA